MLDAIAAFREHIAGLHLSDAKRAVLRCATDVAEARGTTRPALPRRSIVEATGLGERAVRTALAQLDRDGLLVLAVRGLPSGPSAVRRRASCYRLGPAPGSHIPVPEVRSVGPPTPLTKTEANNVGPPTSPNANYVGPPGAPVPNHVGPPVGTPVTVGGVKRIVDDHGHLWPVTGYSCRACGWPLDSVLAGTGTHPTCDE